MIVLEVGWEDSTRHFWHMWLCSGVARAPGMIVKQFLPSGSRRDTWTCFGDWRFDIYRPAPGIAVQDIIIALAMLALRDNSLVCGTRRVCRRHKCEKDRGKAVLGGGQQSRPPRESAYSAILTNFCSASRTLWRSFSAESMELARRRRPIPIRCTVVYRSDSGRALRGPPGARSWDRAVEGGGVGKCIGSHARSAAQPVRDSH